MTIKRKRKKKNAINRIRTTDSVFHGRKAPICLFHLILSVGVHGQQARTARHGFRSVSIVALCLHLMLPPFLHSSPSA